MWSQMSNFKNFLGEHASRPSNLSMLPLAMISPANEKSCMWQLLEVCTQYCISCKSLCARVCVHGYNCPQISWTVPNFYIAIVLVLEGTAANTLLVRWGPNTSISLQLMKHGHAKSSACCTSFANKPETVLLAVYKHRWCNIALSHGPRPSRIKDWGWG